MFFFNATRQSAETRGVSIKKFLRAVKRPSSQIRRRLRKMGNVKRYAIYKLTLPRNFIVRNEFKLLNIDLFEHRNLKLFRQHAWRLKNNSYFYQGHILKDNLRTSEGHLNLTYHDGGVLGNIHHLGRDYKIISVAKNMLAILELKEKQKIHDDMDDSDTTTVKDNPRADNRRLPSKIKIKNSTLKIRNDVKQFNSRDLNQSNQLDHNSNQNTGPTMGNGIDF